MKHLVSPQLFAVSPYEPGEQVNESGWVKLNTNESPFGPSPLVMKALSSVSAERLRLYPDPEAHELRLVIAEVHGLSSDNVFVGNGSDEVLAHAFFAFFRQNSPLLMPDVTYAFYPSFCALYGIARREIALDSDWSIDVDRYRGDCGGVVLANPNAPTGRFLPLAGVRRLLEAHRDCVVLIDEAYVDFGAESATTLLPEFDNLLVVQTLSKSRGLAGLRVGFALGAPLLIDALQRVKNSFNSYPLGVLAQVGAIAAIRDEVGRAQVRRDIEALREWTARGLHGLGFQVVPSLANFVFASHASHDGAWLAQGLRERKVLVRHFPKPRIANHLRITIGTQTQCEALIDALAEFV